MDASIFPVSADAQNEQGLNPNVAIVDELHVAAEKNRDLYDALDHRAGRAREPAHDLAYDRRADPGGTVLRPLPLRERDRERDSGPIPTSA
jgi:hypothetical protein